MASKDVPVEIDPDEAREAAVRELSDPAYAAAEPSPLARALDWVMKRLDELFAGAAGISGIGGLVLLVLLAVVVVVVIRLRVGRMARSARGDHPVFAGGPRSPEEHRKAAQDAVARGDFAEAVRERFRALVRELEQRGVLDERAGRTVDEVAVEAGRELPACADDLRVAAVLFDDVWYGGRPATAEGYERLAAVDDRVRA